MKNEVNKSKKVIIIGAGFGSLALSTMLAKKGYDVSVYEKNSGPGGRARLIERDGFLFDMGPSWYMMPDIFEHYFNLVGENINDYLELEKLSPSYRVFLKSDGKHYDFYSDLEKNKKTFEELEPGAGKKLEDYLKMTEEQYNIAKDEFLYRNYDSVFDFLNFRTAVMGAKMPLFQSQKNIIESRFNSEILQKVMQYQTVLLGTAPKDTPGIYGLMNYVDFVGGIWYPKGGIWEVTKALYKISQKNGVNFHFNSAVKKIEFSGNEATGITLENGGKIDADIVVSNADIHHSDTMLAGEKQQIKNEDWDKKTLAPSALLIYLGVKGKLENLRHHTLILSKDWNQNFEEIFGMKNVWPTDPSIYVCNPSKTDDTVAPENHENLFILVPVAPGLDYTPEFEQKYIAFILKDIGKSIGHKDLGERIVVQEIMNVKDFKTEYNAHKGTALGLAHTLKQTAIFRPNNVHKTVKNLYFVGAGTNPGIGMPICLISAEMVYKRIEGIKTNSGLSDL